MSTHVRPAWTLGASRKRKDRYDPSDAPQPVQPAQLSAAQPSGSRLLGGYLAHEYLTRGTLLGKPVGPPPSRAEPGEKGDLNKVPAPDEPMAEPAESGAGSYYADISRLLMRADGPHVPGVVNPTQLARWIEM